MDPAAQPKKLTRAERHAARISRMAAITPAMRQQAMRDRNRKAGQSRSPKKAAAVRLNGCKGGRPSKRSKMSVAEFAHQAMLDIQQAEAKKARSAARAAAHHARILRMALHLPQLRKPPQPQPKPLTTAEILVRRHQATVDGTLKSGEVPCYCGTCAPAETHPYPFGIKDRKSSGIGEPLQASSRGRLEARDAYRDVQPRESLSSRLIAFQSKA